MTSIEKVLSEQEPQANKEAALLENIFHARDDKGE